MVQSTPSTTPDSSYDPALFSLLYEVEDRHFWFRTRNRIISELVRQVTSKLQPTYKVLEVGCGTGNVLRFLEKICGAGHVAGMDLFAEGLQFARQRVACPLIQADMHQPPFTETFDVVGLFDVLEHLPDDIQVLQDLHTLLKPGGALLLTVPAHMSLWSYFDIASHHYRRYDLPGLKAKLEQAGFRVTYLSYYMAMLYPLVWSGRRFAALQARLKNTAESGKSEQLAAQELKITPIINGILTQLLYLESRLTIGQKHLAIGTSLICLAYKETELKHDHV